MASECLRSALGLGPHPAALHSRRNLTKGGATGLLASCLPPHPFVVMDSSSSRHHRRSRDSRSRSPERKERSSKSHRERDDERSSCRHRSRSRSPRPSKKHRDDDGSDREEYPGPPQGVQEIDKDDCECQPRRAAGEADLDGRTQTSSRVTS